MKVNVVIGTPVNWSYIHRYFLLSCLSLTVPEGTMWVQSNQVNVPEMRNDIVREALRVNAKYVFFMDGDMTFPKDALIKLISRDKDMIGGLYFRRGPPYEPFVYADGGAPYTYKMIPMKDWNEVQKVASTGCGCMLIKTKVFRGIPEPWFFYAAGTHTAAVTEDHSFFTKAKKYGFEVYVDTTVECGHLAEITIDKGFYEASGGK